MRAWTATGRWSGAGVAAATLAVPWACAAASLDFDSVFNDRGEPAQAHYAASYLLGGNKHRVEVWRDGEHRVRRRTDDAIETLAVRPAGALEWSMSVLDLKQKIRTDVDRSNLFRIGHFTDWFALSHSLAHPSGPYALSVLPSAERPKVSPVGPCRWFALTQGEQTSKVCWSARQRVALVVTNAADIVQWRVISIDSRPVPAETYVLDDRGFVRNDANRDIQAD